MGGINGIQYIADLFANLLREVVAGQVQPWLDQSSILLHADIWILVFIVQYPALTLRNGLAAEFVAGNFISPLAEGAFSEFLDVAFMHQGNGASFFLDGIANGGFDQSFRRCAGDRLDAYSGISPALLLRPFHLLPVYDVNPPPPLPGSPL